jgi:hypothetical protein
VSWRSPRAPRSEIVSTPARSDMWESTKSNEIYCISP